MPLEIEVHEVTVARPKVSLLVAAREEAEAQGCTLPPDSQIELWIDNLAPPLDAVCDAVTNLMADKERIARLMPWLLKVMRCEDTSPEREETMRADWMSCVTRIDVELILLSRFCIRRDIF